MITKITHDSITEIASHFDLCGEVMAIKECRSGHINSTYFITCHDGKNSKRYTMQLINTDIFKNPDEVMENIVNVTEHIRTSLEHKGIDPSRRTLRVIYTSDGKWGYVDSEGRYWRFYEFIENADNYMQIASSKMFERVGYAFGQFQMQLADFDASVLHETIPNFHNTEVRLSAFERAVERDVCDRARLVEQEIKFVRERSHIAPFINQGIADGTLKLRVTHNDTKLNNIMIDQDTGEGICVIDLDTVMPGSVLADFGDSIRFGASSAAEDETNLDGVYCRLDMFDAYAKGFIEGLEGRLTESEIRALPMGALVITYEQGIRFLTDYLEGDTYFRTEYEHHNLDRARNQLKLVADIESKMGEMQKMIEKYIK